MEKNKKYILTIYTCGKKQNINNQVFKNWKENNYGEKVIEVLKLIIIDIKTKIEDGEDDIILMIFIDSINKEEIKKILEIINEETLIYLPEIIFAFADSTNIFEIIDFHKYLNISIRHIHLINYYYLNFEEKLLNIYKYMLNIGNLKLFPDELFNKDFDSYIHEDKIKQSNKYYATFNIILIGHKGAGKSTLVNILLDKIKSRESNGLYSTLKIINFLDDKSPLLLIDSPGFSEKKEVLKMINYFNYYSNIFSGGKYQIHLVLYLLNSLDERDFTKEEYNLIDTIKNQEIPIFFVCTRSKNINHSKNFEAFIKVSLKKKFGKNTNFVEHIYSCHLLDEKYKIYNKFGLDRLIQGIIQYFNLDFFKSLIIKNIERVINFNIDSLNFPENFKETKTFLSINVDNIINNYLNMISKMPDLKQEEIEEKIYEHLKYEMNIKDNIYEEYKTFINREKEANIVNSASSTFCLFNINFNGKNYNHIKSIRNSIKDFFLEKVKNRLNKYFDEILDDYKNVIDYLSKKVKSYQHFENTPMDNSNFLNIMIQNEFKQNIKNNEGITDDTIIDKQKNEIISTRINFDLIFVIKKHKKKPKKFDG